MCSDWNPKTPQPRKLIIALGSNLGDSESIFSWAIEKITQSLSHDGFQVSGFVKSTPVDCPDGSPDFLNAVMYVDWLVEEPIYEASEDLLLFLKELESEAGRRPKKVLNEPRPLDLDIIDIENYQHNSASLIIPHPRAHERSFVMQPLKEILPNYLF